MFSRLILKSLDNWAVKKNRKPLILRGARQVGKTTIVDLFSKNFAQYIKLNLEFLEDRSLFEKNYSIDELISAIFFLKNKEKKQVKTLIFIDEIQNSPEAVAMLRYFYEQADEYFVIAAGSLLETAIDCHISFPIGRVEFLYVKPLTFIEYLEALKEEQTYKAIKQVPFPVFAHDKLLKEFYRFTLIGGMPEIIAEYLQSKNIANLKPIYEGLLRGYLDDIEKYAKNKSLAKIMRYVLEHSFYLAGGRIRFEGFGNSNYRSREVGEALRTLEKAMLVKLVYPATTVQLPIIPDHKKSPGIYIVDTGLVNYFAGLQKQIFNTQDLNSVYDGRIAEHIVAQELFAVYHNLNEKVQFWVREKKSANSEIDFIVPFENYVIPIEVKTGKTGRLRSLHEFMDRTPHNYAVRIYSGEFSIDKVETIKGKKFLLLNLPFYCAGMIKEYLKWFIK